MHLLRRARKVSRTAAHGLGVYGAMREARGRLSKKHMRRPLVVAAGAGLVAGLAGGYALGARLGSRCGHEHHHAPGHDHAGDLADVPVEEPVAHAADRALTP